MKKKNIRLIGLAAAALIILAGCGSKSGQESARSAGNDSAKTLRYPLEANIVTFDPAKIGDVPTYQVVMQMHEGLVRAAENSEPELALAESYQLSKDGRVYTFTLKKGVKFHNGKEVTVEDVIWSFNRNCDPKVASSIAEDHLGDIVGLKEKLTGKADTIKGIQAIGTDKIQITIKEPKSYFLSKLISPAASVMPRGDVPLDPITDLKHVVGCGPFKLEDFQSDQRVVLSRHDDYHGKKPAVERQEISIVKDAIVRMAKYKSGAFDYCAVPSNEIPAIEKDAKIGKELHKFPHASIFYIALNPLVCKPFKDVRVRQAIAMSIDNKLIADQILNKTVQPAEGMIPKGIPGCRDKVNKLGFDPSRAKVLLSEAGYGSGKKPLELELYIGSSTPVAKMVTENVATQLKKHLGISVSVKQLDWSTFLAKHNQKEIPFSMCGWAADYPDPANFLSDLFVSTAGLNRDGYSNPAFDKLCRKADTHSNFSERMAMYAEAEDLLLKDAAAIPLYYRQETFLIRKGVEGFRTNLIGVMPHTHVVKAN